MPEVTHGHGSAFFLEHPTTTVMTELGEVIDIPELPSGVRALFETSHLKTVGFKKYRKEPLAEADEIEVQMNFIPSSPTDLLCRAAKASDKELGCRIVLPTGEGDDTYVAEFECLVMDYTRTNPGADRRVGTLTIKPVSEPVESAVEGVAEV
jgi:hypothetical protein